MQTHIQELVSLHSKLIERCSKELADLFIDQLTLCFFVGGMGLFPGIPGFRNWMFLVGRNPKAFSEALDHAFKLLPYHDEMTFELDIKEVDQVRKINGLDWNGMSPFIFGRVFELTLETGDRSRLGAHYTPEDDIRELIEPVIFKELRFKLERAKILINRGVSDIERRELVRMLLRDIRSVSILDPACGAGNFLLICLWNLLDLESEAIKLAGGVFGTIPCVNLTQLYGIEKDSRAFRLMRLVLWMGYIQWMKKNFDENVQIDPFVIPDSRNFMNCDAVLDLNDSEFPVERVWPEVDYIVGNPPYLGASRMRQSFGDSYCDMLNWVFTNRVPGSADFGAYWFEKARDMIDRGQTKAAGFVISTAIRQEWSRPVLDRVNQSGKIFFAISDRVWYGNEAAVHVSLIGFTGPGYFGDLMLDGKIVPVIYSNLSATHNASELKQRNNNSYTCISGSGDVLENSVDQEVAFEIIRNLSPTELNPLRPFIGGRDLVQGSSNRWTTCNQGNTEIKFSQKRYLVTPRVSKHCVFLWLDSVVIPDSGVVCWDSDDSYLMGILQSKVHRAWTLANCGWRGETRAYQTGSCFKSFMFPCVDDSLEEEIRQSAERLNTLRNKWLYPEQLTKKVHVKFCASRDGVWQNYSVGDIEDTLISVDYILIRPMNSVAEKILSKRTVTALYNENPPWLQEAYRELSDLVLGAYGWESDISDEEIVASLRLLNTGKTGGSDSVFSF